MTNPLSSSLGYGFYDVSEASRISGVSNARIHRWLRGYTYKASSGDERSRPALWKREYSDAEALTLSFRDLQEIRVINALLNRGLQWKTLRHLARQAAKVFNTTHPLSSRKFLTDGKTLLVEPPEPIRSSTLLDLIDNQYTFKRVMEPFLEGIDYSSRGEPLRWWPLGTKKSVVLDPARSFGTPIVQERMVPTSVLAKGVEIEGSVQAVARWYGVSPKSVKHAVEFEQSLEAA